MLKDVDTSPVVKIKVSAYAIILTRLDERGSAYLCYDRVISAIDGHMLVKK